MPDVFAHRSAILLFLFRCYLHFLFWWRFSAVRLSHSQVPARHEGQPLVLYSNHPSWWDPALYMLMSEKLFPGRLGFGPMDADSLEKYAFFRRLGVFGVPAGRPGATIFARLTRAALANPRAALWITAEGAFTDARTRPLSLKPGIAHIPKFAPNAIFLPVALEYVFWNKSRPEALIKFGAPLHLTGKTSAQRLTSLTAALQNTMDGLAAEACARNHNNFITLWPIFGAPALP